MYVWTVLVVLFFATITSASISPDITYRLYTKNQLYHPIWIDPSSPTDLLQGPERLVFLIHGWYDYGPIPWYEECKNALLLNKNDFKVVQVHWEALARRPYEIVARDAKIIGQQIGGFIASLNATSAIHPDQIVLIGDTLGAHVAGFVGKTVQNSSGVPVQQIIALDPSGRLFVERTPDNRLNATDARIVRVIHTDSQNEGTDQLWGTIDFFPNNGTNQPGCEIFTVLTYSAPISPLLISSTVVVPILHIPEPNCNVARSWLYFIEALRNPAVLKGKRCQNWQQFTQDGCEKTVEVGLGDLDSTETGKFYLATLPVPPFVKTVQLFF